MDGLKSLATTADINCSSSPSASGATFESFCFRLQTMEMDTMHFPRLLLFTEDGAVYSLPKQIYMAAELVKTMVDVVKGSYIDKAHRVGSFDSGVDCPSEDFTCLTTWLPAGLPFVESCADMFEDCPRYKRQGQCEFFREICEISCEVCRPVPANEHE